MAAVNFFAGGGLDRVGRNRRDAAWLEAQIAHEATRFVPVWRARSLVRRAEAGSAAVVLERPALAQELTRDHPLALLGVAHGVAHFALDLSSAEEPIGLLPPDPAAGASFEDLRSVGGLLGRADASLLAYARGLTYWHSRHRFCGVCGHATLSEEGGHVRRCTNAACNTTHFPRTDPAVIMLVTDGENALLGRQASWPKGFYSVLAGFVEPGESLEEAVAREVLEESGIVVDDVTYQSSQPWPFPCSIMLGFRATARTTAIRHDDAELEDARWVSRAWLRAVPVGEGFRMPPPISIARQLIEEWLAEG